MSSYTRPSAEQAKSQGKNARKGAVLILLYPRPGEGIHTVLIERPETGSVHSGQMAFPGGGKEMEDLDLERTALREAQEELGIQEDKARILGRLSEIYIPPSDYLVTPYLASFHGRPELRPCPVEVADHVEIPLSFFLQKDAIQKRRVRAGKKGVILEVPAFVHEERVIWGATAMMLAELRSMLLQGEEKL